MKSKKIYFENSKGDILCGLLAEGNLLSTSSKVIVIAAHGLNISKDSSTNTELEQKLLPLGISMLRIDFFGHGESEGRFNDITISEGVDDISCAVQYAKGLGYKKIILLGASFGGMVCILTAAKDREGDIIALALKCPVSDYYEVESLRKTPDELDNWQKLGYFDYIDGLGNQRRIHYSFYKDFANHDPQEAAKNIRIPTVIIHGSEDPRVPISQSIYLQKLINNSKLKIIEGANHHFSKPEEKNEVVNILYNFIVQHSMQN